MALDKLGFYEILKGAADKAGWSSCCDTSPDLLRLFVSLDSPSGESVAIHDGDGTLSVGITRRGRGHSHVRLREGNYAAALRFIRDPRWMLGLL